MLEQVCCQNLGPHGGPTLQKFMKDVERTQGGEGHEGFLPWVGPQVSGEECGDPPTEEEGAAQTTCDEPTKIPIPHPSALLRNWK